MDLRNGTPGGALPLPVIPDDARVAVEPIDAKAVAASTGGSSKPGSAAHPRPGPIANWGLLKLSGSRRLKDKLVFTRDFYVRRVTMAASVGAVGSITPSSRHESDHFH